MKRQKCDLPAGQVENGYHHKRHEKMEPQTQASRNQSALVRVRTEQSSGDSLQSAARADAALPPDYKRGRNVQNADDQAGSQNCAKCPEVFHTNFAELTLESRKSGSKETITAKMHRLLQI